MTKEEALAKYPFLWQLLYDLRVRSADSAVVEKPLSEILDVMPYCHDITGQHQDFVQDTVMVVAWLHGPDGAVIDEVRPEEVYDGEVVVGGETISRALARNHAKPVAFVTICTNRVFKKMKKFGDVVIAKIQD